jgi:hypothetical protein
MLYIERAVWCLRLGVLALQRPRFCAAAVSHASAGSAAHCRRLTGPFAKMQTASLKDVLAAFRLGAAHMGGAPATIF